jgi:hypothetical protein
VVVPSDVTHTREVVMKHAALVLAGTLVLAATVSATAQERNVERDFYDPGTKPEFNVKRAVMNYKHCLESPIQGILEESLGDVILMKLLYPNEDFTSLKDGIMRLATEGPTGCIRYRASLAAMVFDSPETFAGTASIRYASTNELFSTVAARAKPMLLTDNR